jgi:glutamyl-tRNA synthetase
MTNVRVRFAPSPTGALHIGGVRTALFNYLFAKKQKGTFILRIEDTDQTRFVEGAEQYIVNSLEWLGLDPDESPEKNGPYGPYRQSERQSIYQEYVKKLLAEGKAYYAFDTPEELDEMRQRLQESRVLNPQYDTFTRSTMKNSLTLPEEEVQQRLEDGEPYVVRIKVPQKEEVRFKDLIRGWVRVNTEVIDDKELVKSDGMPTYHLANVVDDYLMKISHVIRGEEWLPSAPLHVLLYQFLGWEDSMPEFAHLPLILKPDGNGKLSKRAADKAGFPIFPLNWIDPDSKIQSTGFKETGFLPSALINFLAFLGWNPGTDQELFIMSELIETFSLDKVNKAGTKFDFDKAKWFNQQYLKTEPSASLAQSFREELETMHHLTCDEETAKWIIELLRERVTFPNEFVEKSLILFQPPTSYDDKTFRKKWNEDAENALELFASEIKEMTFESPEVLKEYFWSLMEKNNYKPGQLMPALRLAVTGQGSGPDLMTLCWIIGAPQLSKRIKSSIELLKSKERS